MSDEFLFGLATDEHGRAIVRVVIGDLEVKMSPAVAGSYAEILDYITRQAVRINQENLTQILQSGTPA